MECHESIFSEMVSQNEGNQTAATLIKTGFTGYERRKCKDTHLYLLCDPHLISRYYKSGGHKAASSGHAE